MATKRAKTLTDREIERLLRLVENSPIVESDRLKILLSFYAGLRVSEIAKLKTEAMLTADGRVAPYITIFSNVGKNGKERSIPMHPRIGQVVRSLKSQLLQGIPSGTLGRSWMAIIFTAMRRWQRTRFENWKAGRIRLDLTGKPSACSPQNTRAFPRTDRNATVRQ